MYVFFITYSHLDTTILQVSGMLSQEMEQIKQEIITIRITDGLKKELLVESKEKKISLNTLLNQILFDHNSWNKPIKELSWITFSNNALRSILEQLTKEEIIKISTTILKDEIKNCIFYFYGVINLESIMKFMVKWFQINNIKSRNLNENGKKQYVFQHEMGMNYSILFLNLLESLLSEIGYKITKESSNHRSFSFHITNIL